ncbi:MAG: hypothetical protein F6K56_29410, partial [Moorea sp. SIO3G5]|nr:hypothetical protein [Moorena sp. SIO3G5]
LGLQYLLSEEGQFLRRELLLALTEDDQLHGAEIQSLWNLVKDDLPPGRLFNVALNALSTISSDGIGAILPKSPIPESPVSLERG